MSKRSNGFVLLAVLVFMQVFMLMSLLAYQNVSLSLKSKQQAWEQQKKIWHARYLKRKIVES